MRQKWHFTWNVYIYQINNYFSGLSWPTSFLIWSRKSIFLYNSNETAQQMEWKKNFRKKNVLRVNRKCIVSKDIFLSPSLRFSFPLYLYWVEVSLLKCHNFFTGSFFWRINIKAQMGTETRSLHGTFSFDSFIHFQ